MIAKTYSIVPDGFAGSTIEVEGDKSNGLPGFNIVGMATKTVSEARERVKAAIKSSGFLFPDKKLTINLAPADQEKDGTFLDIAIALNVLILSRQLHQSDVDGSAFVGELSLDGTIRPVRGIINIVETARSAGFKRLFIPVKNFEQASLIKKIELVPVASLFELYLLLKRQQNSSKNSPIALTPQNVVKNTKTSVRPEPNSQTGPTFDQISGQTFAKRALEIAVAGHHNILLSGPPGTGKTLLAKAALDLLPPLNNSESIAVTKLYSLAGLTEEIISSRPFRSPHHTSSAISLIGGGTKAAPGEISLAHLGVLFLDELPEYPRATLESLRQPLEDCSVSISRAKRRVTYPADFMLIATMNPCPCGYYGDDSHPCSCTEHQIKTYQHKLSGPFLDRIDLFVTVERIKTTKLLSATKTAPNNTSLTTIKSQIKRALNTQKQRYSHAHHPSTSNPSTSNASLSSYQVSQLIPLDSQAKHFLDVAADSLDLSARSYFKIIKVARTIADLDGSVNVTEKHLAEALTFRQKPLEKTLSF